LASAIILVALVMGTARVIHQFRRYSRSNYHGELAKNYAESGIRHAIYFTTVAPDWRQLLNSGVWLQDIPVDQATYTVSGVDPVDDDLTNGGNVLFTATATVGDISRTIQVEATEEKIPLEVLHYAAVSGSDLQLQQKTHINGDVTSNNNISTTATSGITGNAEAVGTITGNISGTTTSGCAPKTIPDMTSILQYYRSVATDIPYQGTIENVLLSPTSNPFGSTNPDGVYRIQCNGGAISFSDCRIVGTIILESPSTISSLTNGINWCPARPDYPALLVSQNGLNIKILSDLSESSVGIDFSLPTESGYGNLTDVYPGLIQGLIYVENILYFYKKSHLVGTAITKNVFWPQNDAIVDYDPAILTNPPIGFFTISLEPVQGTWQLVAP